VGAGTGNPLTGNYRTKDGRHIQLMFLQGDRYWRSSAELSAAKTSSKTPLCRFGRAAS